MSKATDDLVDRFAAALKEKLAAAEKKYGFDDAWRKADWRRDLVDKLQEHVMKGDPRDVAAYCAFAWHHGWRVSPPPANPPMTEPAHRIPSRAEAFRRRQRRQSL